jgi:hypothetical protein
MNCDHVSHAAAPAPATTSATFAWADGRETTQHLCATHTEELQTLWARGATAFGRITNMQITVL